MSSSRSTTAGLPEDSITGANDLESTDHSKPATTSDAIDLTGDSSRIQDDLLSKTIHIDPYGDLLLIVGDEKICFVVCSRALSRSAPFWNTLLYGPFAEEEPSERREWKVKLPENHPAGLEIILNLIHWPGQSAKIPKVDLNLAYEVTVLTNKYSMTHCLVPCA